MRRLAKLATLVPVAVLVAGAAAAQMKMIDPSILADPTRPDEERAQDEGRKPLELYEWLGIQPGMTVADLWASTGYNTHLLSRVVGGSGKVDSVLQFYADKEAFGGRVYSLDKLTDRVGMAHLTNVTICPDFPDVPDGSVDVALAVRNFHDLETTFPDLKRADAVAQIHRILKPGGVVGVVEVATDNPGWDEKAHRLNQQVVIDAFEAGGFELVDSSDMLASSMDDHMTAGFPNRHTLDRYVLKFRKSGMSMM